MVALKELKIGEALPSIELKPVTRLDLIKYAGASGDFNPIHTIDKEAEKAGLPGIIAHGMWTMGNMTQLFSSFYEEGFVQKFVNRFSGMVFLGDVLTLKAVLSDQEENDMIFKVEAVKQDGQAAAKGVLTFRLF